MPGRASLFRRPDFLIARSSLVLLVASGAAACAKPTRNDNARPANGEASGSVAPVASASTAPDASGVPAASPSVAAAKNAEPWQRIGISMAAPPGSTEGIGCDEVLPLGLRADAGLGGGAEADAAPQSDATPAGPRINESGGRGTLRCAFIDPSDRRRQRVFEYNCDAAQAPPAELRARHDRFLQTATEARDVPHAGFAAWAGTTEGMGQAHVYDDKSPCELVISFVGNPPPTDDLVRTVYEQFRAAITR